MPEQLRLRCGWNRRRSAAEIIAVLTCREVRVGSANGEAPHKLAKVTRLKAIGRRDSLIPETVGGA